MPTTPPCANSDTKEKIAASMLYSKVTPKQLWMLYTIAAATFLFSLFYSYVGEEGVYTITSLEMWKNHDFFLPTLYGINNGRPPFYNWLIIPLANLLGWSHVLVAARIVAATATVTTGIVLAWLAKRLTNNGLFAAFAAIIFFSRDTLFDRGWLAYSEPLFALCIFSAIAFLWAGLHTKKTSLIWPAIIFITCGALTKVQTAYIFYLVALGVFLLNFDYRKVALSLNSITAHIAGLLLYIGWYFFITKGMQNTTSSLISDKLFSLDWFKYFNQLWYFPLQTIFAFLPASGVLIYLWLRKRLRFPHTSKKHWLFYALIIAFFNWLPYWLFPHSGIRYIVPIYPFIALVIAYFIFASGEKGILLMTKWFVALIIIKIIFATVAFPYYHNHYRGHYKEVAQEILSKTQSSPLYINDYTATGLSIAASIDTLLYPKSPIQFPPAKFNSGFVLSDSSESKFGQLVNSYKLGGSYIYLFKVSR